jgi:hypothetical protein
LKTNYQHIARVKAPTRAVIASALIVLWAVSALTGFLLYVAPTGQRSGRLILLFLTKGAWGDVHFWISLAAGIVTIIHVAIDWKALKACMRFLVSTERGEQPSL